MASSSIARSPYRDETHGMAERCARLEEELAMLRRSIRELSAKNASPRTPHARRRRPRLVSPVAKAFALVLTMVLTCAGWAVPRRYHGCRPPAKSGLMGTLLGFSGYL